MVAAKQNLAVFVSASKLQDTWRIVPGIVSWLVTPIYKPWMAIYKGNNPI